jgi:hypothetical protein
VYELVQIVQIKFIVRGKGSLKFILLFTYLFIYFKREVHTGFWWGDLREGDHLGDPGVDGRIILKYIFKK